MKLSWVCPSLCAWYLSTVYAQSQQPLQNEDAKSSPYRVAIIGAGPAGASTAYHLTKYARAAGVALDITIFDRNDYIGGRSTTVNALGDPRYPVELGASIFVAVNQILVNATRDFQLPVSGKIYESTGAKYDVGIWDGDGFVYLTESSDDNDEDTSHRWKDRLIEWWDIAKLLWRYGLSPVRLRNLQQSTIGRFLRMYQDHFPFPDLTSTVRQLDLTASVDRSGVEFLLANGVGEQFQREIVQAATRVNYAQNLGTIHGLGSVVSMSTDGAMSVEGGNWHMFEAMVKYAGAQQRLNHTVTKVTSTATGELIVDFQLTNLEEAGSIHEIFDAVVLAAPVGLSNITFNPPPTYEVPRPDYVDLYVTLLTSPYRPSAVYFNKQAGIFHSNSTITQSKKSPLTDAEIPDSILTTLPDALQPYLSHARGTAGLASADFWSLSTLQVLHPASDGYISPLLTEGTIPASNLEVEQKQYLYKIFSPAPISANTLIQLFNWHGHAALTDSCRNQVGDEREYCFKQASVSTLPRELITWSHEKLWQSYPYLTPLSDFACWNLYSCKNHSIPVVDTPETAKGSSPDSADTATVGHSISVKPRVWMTSPMEEFISTMETSALSGMNVARLVIDDVVYDGKKEV